MFALLCLAFVTFVFIAWKRKFPYPKLFPPGPRLPLPLVGDGWRLGQDITQGIRGLQKQYGNVIGMYFGPQRTVVVCDYGSLNKLLSMDEVADRPPFPAVSEARGEKE